MKRKALGKGLRSLIPEAPPPKADAKSARTPGSLPEIDLDRIFPNPDQPRKRFDAEQLEELAASLKKDGLLQPVVVRPRGADAYELIAGERRWRAAQIAGLMKIPVVVRDVDDPQLLELALVENLQREQLDPLEEARAYQVLIDDHEWTQADVAERVGKSRATVANALRLLNLAPAVQTLVRDDRLSAGHAKALAAITDDAEQTRLAELAAREGLSVRDVERRVRALKNPPTSRSAPAKADPNLAAAEERLGSAVGSKVRIVSSKKGGRIELHAFSDEELQRLYDIVLRGSRAD